MMLRTQKSLRLQNFGCPRCARERESGNGDDEKVVNRGVLEEVQ